MSRLQPDLFQVLASICFVFALIHTFSVGLFQRYSRRFPPGSSLANLFHLLAEVEVVFGVWAGIFIVLSTFLVGSGEVLSYLESRNFSEAMFIFVIMAICSTQPILNFAEGILLRLSSLIPLPSAMGFYITVLSLGPLLGSFITEPAAMTISALLVAKSIFSNPMSSRLKYITVGLLFVNISVGGTMTPFAAPPVLMVASTWNWDLDFMLRNFAWKAVLTVVMNTALVTLLFAGEIGKMKLEPSSGRKKTPLWITLLHLLVLFFVVVGAHHPVIFVGLFLFFLGVVNITKEHQLDVRLKNALLVAFFLAGLVVLGGPQKWWLEPILGSLSSFPLYLGSIFLTSFTDNAALTYLASQVAHLSVESRFAVVAGSVVGGGMTVIANAPNPAGYSILNACFGKDGIRPGRLAIAALGPTVVAAIIFFL